MNRCVITAENIFEACNFADDVLYELRIHEWQYNLNSLERKPYEDNVAKECVDFMEMKFAKNMKIQDVDDLSASDIKEKYLNPYLPLARKFFRGEYPYPYIISEGVSDDYLDNLLCVRFRDLLRIIVIRDTALISK